MGAILHKRQIYGYDDNYYWWDSPVSPRPSLSHHSTTDPLSLFNKTTIIIKWIILAVILILIIGLFGGGYIHAKRRMRKGLAPLAYHRVSHSPSRLTLTSQPD